MRDLMISGRALDIYNYMNESGVIDFKASTVSIEFNISIQHASSILSKLESQGYLCKLRVPQESGGYEWIYSVS